MRRSRWPCPHFHFSVYALGTVQNRLTDQGGSSLRHCPHLHCGKNFITLSKGKKSHNNLQGKCSTVNRILSDVNGYYGNAGNKQAIINALTAYKMLGARHF